MTFEEQFAKREYFDIDDGKIECVDIQPTITSTDIPLLFAPGWGATLDTHKDTIKILVEKNRRVLSLSHLRPATTIPKELLAKETVYEINEKTRIAVPHAVMRKTKAILTLLQNKQIKKTDAIAHSEGAINLIIAACLQPQKFRNILLICPAGFVVKDTLPQLAKRFSKEVWQKIKFLAPYSSGRKTAKPEILERFSRAGKEMAKYIFGAPRLAYEETMAISKTETRHLLAYLRDQGILISIIHGVDDNVFPLKELEKLSKDQSLSGFYTIQGNHADIYINPEYYSDMISQAFEVMDNQRKQIKQENEKNS